MAANSNYVIIEDAWPDVSDDNEGELSTRPSRWRSLLTRAVCLYLGLLLSLSLFLSILGVDPLVHNGALAKGLLLYIGLATLLALVYDDDESLIDQQARSRLALFTPRKRCKHLFRQDTH